jgi:hypothetical protein
MLEHGQNILLYRSALEEQGLPPLEPTTEAIHGLLISGVDIGLSLARKSLFCKPKVAFLALLYLLIRQHAITGGRLA